MPCSLTEIGFLISSSNLCHIPDSALTKISICRHASFSPAIPVPTTVSCISLLFVCRHLQASYSLHSLVQFYCSLASPPASYTLPLREASRVEEKCSGHHSKSLWKLPHGQIPLPTLCAVGLPVASLTCFAYPSPLPCHTEPLQNPSALIHYHFPILQRSPWSILLGNGHEMEPANFECPPLHPIHAWTIPVYHELSRMSSNI